MAAWEEKLLGRSDGDTAADNGGDKVGICVGIFRYGNAIPGVVAYGKRG